MGNRVPGEHIYNVTDEDIKVAEDHLNQLVMSVDGSQTHPGPELNTGYNAKDFNA